MLNIKERNQLRGLAHKIKPVINVGKKGHSDALISEIDGALLAHELIKVQFQKSALDDIEVITNLICEKLSSQLVEIRGHVATLYRAHPDKPRIRL
jgi:RNA-binding protein